MYGRLGVYRAIFRHTGISILKTLTKGIAIQAFSYATILWTLYILGVVHLGSVELPRSILIIAPLLILVSTLGIRALAHTFLSGLFKAKSKYAVRNRLLIYGAGNAGIQVLTAIQNSSSFSMIGFIDDNPSIQGREIYGHRIYSEIDLVWIVPQMGVTDIILAMPTLNRTDRFQLLEKLSVYPVHVRSLPNLEDLATGQIQIQDVKELDITDLLGRQTVQPDPILITRTIKDKVVLVTGAGGSIGSELSRQILKIGPSKLILLEISEFSLYSIDQDLRNIVNLGKFGQSTEILSLIGSVQNQARIDDLLRKFSPDTIFHAAAYKHVPLVEQNPFEGIQNNVFGTLIIATSAMFHKVKNFVLVSTDKAVRPTNIMGASKRLAEMILQALAEENSHTIFSIVRFGNVLGSSGSVVPLFRQQINQGGPITLTDFEVTRYFMTTPEASELVIQASAMAQGGEVFVLNMGEPIKIYELALRMVRLSGLTLKSEENPNGDIEIVKVGLRPGEKLYEELLIGENSMPTIHPRIMQARENFLSWSQLQNELNILKTNVNVFEKKLVIEQLKKLVTGFIPDVRVFY